MMQPGGKLPKYIKMTKAEYELYSTYYENLENAQTRREVDYWYAKCMEIVEAAVARQEKKSAEEEQAAYAVAN